MSAQQDFIISELWILSWGASVQRAKLFVDGVLEAQRKRFRREIIEYADTELLPSYSVPVSDSEHCARIGALSEYGTSIGAGVLGPAGYKIGVAQKLLNLQLKYMWCLGLAAEPPHCPVDRVMIQKTRLRNRVAWTQIHSLPQYLEVIASLREVAGSKSLAEWELEIYDRADA